MPLARGRVFRDGYQGYEGTEREGHNKRLAVLHTAADVAELPPDQHHAPLATVRVLQGEH